MRNPGLSFQSTPGINAGRIIKTRSSPLILSGFNPRPALMPGESSCIFAKSSCLIWFQSTPGINAGRIGILLALAHGFGCFNPRPALMPGESQATFGWVNEVKVSIHARH